MNRHQDAAATGGASRRRGGVAGAGPLPPSAVMVLSRPVVLFAGAGNPPCNPRTPAPPRDVTDRRRRGRGRAVRRAARHAPGRWYRVGATEYGCGIGSSGLYLPDYPDTFAELSLLDSNPYTAFTFADANALNNLPYGTAIGSPTVAAHGADQA